MRMLYEGLVVNKTVVNIARAMQFYHSFLNSFQLPPFPKCLITLFNSPQTPSPPSQTAGSWCGTPGTGGGGSSTWSWRSSTPSSGWRPSSASAWCPTPGAPGRTSSRCGAHPSALLYVIFQCSYCTLLRYSISTLLYHLPPTLPFHPFQPSLPILQSPRGARCHNHGYEYSFHPCVLSPFLLCCNIDCWEGYLRQTLPYLQSCVVVFQWL